MKQKFVFVGTALLVVALFFIFNKNKTPTANVLQVKTDDERQPSTLQNYQYSQTINQTDSAPKNIPPKKWCAVMV
ncbi:hypothetical protein H5181_13565 [Shewanella sp. SG44-2]|uniref:hypothetical protein n=1 Tax=Shewanella sp. SG44-2 TaxID=2760962 RepID=UPI0015FFB31F|nr:hypothetical protein [Shewanella sp. SG44-2]MBB1427492.1 hypothetical protein [Shewanella sp. SG44-2]